MPSEVVSKENEVGVEAKEVTEKSDLKTETKENSSAETKVSAEIESNATVSNGSEGLSENENKENEEPTIKDEETLKKEADELLLNGKRCLLIGDFQEAADVLSEACNLFGQVYGEMAEECAEAYFKYGCALLELSKDQINPVGLEEKDDEDNEEMSGQEDSVSETKNDVSDDKEKSTLSVETDRLDEKSVENKNEEASVDKEKSDGVEEKSDKAEEKSDEVENNSTEQIKISNEDEKPEKENADEEDLEEDDVNDLQLAWEMLDLAKVIYKNKDTEESKLKLAEVLMKCGEVSFEDEKFETAIVDITESLEIRRLLLPEDSRIIAETLFQLGIAQELGGSSATSVELLTEAAAVLEQRIKNLENSTDEKSVKEVAEIKTIIPEIKEKIIDLKERKQAAVCALMAAVGASSKATNGGGSSSSPTKQVSNISHLVRKRPKQEDASTTTVPNKVPKLEESTATKQ